MIMVLCLFGMSAGLHAVASHTAVLVELYGSTSHSHRRRYQSPRQLFGQYQLPSSSLVARGYTLVVECRVEVAEEKWELGAARAERKVDLEKSRGEERNC